MKQVFITTALVAVFWGGCASAKVIRGQVKDYEGIPLSNILVKVRGKELVVKTDKTGLFTLDLPVGEYTLDVEGGRDAHFHQVIQVREEEQAPFVISLQTEVEHKMVVRVNPLEHTSLDMATPTIMMTGDELTMNRATTLGDILQFEAGVSVSSFGPAVSRPVIRGLSGSRVKITNNQMTVQDASTTSADHDAGLEPLLAEQIEVVKGPATLLYGSGAIGGIVNASDRKINPDIVDGVSGGVELRLGDSATGEESAIFTLDGGTDSWNWHIDGYTSETDDIKIPGGAESEILHEFEEEHEEPGEEHEDEHESEGILENSKTDTKGGSIGSTWVGDWGYFGLAVSQLDKTYGVPGHAEHHEEEGEEEHHEEEEHHDEGVYIDMEQTRYDVQGQFNDPMAGFEKLFVGYALTDYKHAEVEGDEIGTRFANKAWEFRSYLKHKSWNDWIGVLGVQASQRDFSAMGDEAFVPESKTKNQAIFILEERTNGNLKWELGARYESQSIEGASFSTIDNSGVSLSAGSVYTLSEHNKLAVNLSKATRFASAEELLSDGPHISTRSYEIGNQNLDEETSINFDFSYRFEVDRLSGEINLFWNDFKDFIYAANVSELDPCASVEAAEEAEHDELQLVCYKQQDAEFKGAEVQLEVVLNPESEHQFKLGLVTDFISAEFDNGNYIPRIPPSKAGISLSYDFDSFSSTLSWMSYSRQDKIADNELPTEGFDILDFEAAYRIPFESNELFLFLKGKNLLDEEARDHSSFLKDLAPRVGKNITLGVRYTF
ncbi:TonB-dependent receptor [Aliikangiella sp. IMCC44359]|uniref:TonB-dependent receptor n=1 Tax=Aliikangiella sp. IMCC44359 TaxID=3459125 RepID=UPI00403AD954